MRRILYGLLGIVLMSWMITSCTEELDFNQFDDLEATPTVEASILYLEAQEDLINLISGANVFSQNFNFDAFSSEFFSERVLDGSLTFVVENTTSKELQIVLELLDESDNVTDTEFFSIPAAPTAIIQREIAYGATGRSLDIIRTLSTIRVTATNLGDNSSVSALQNPQITLRSSGRFRLRAK